MTWEHIDDRLQRALTGKVKLPAGTIWLPEHDLSVDEWLMSVAETDEELRELDIRRIRFLQNRWVIEKLVQLEWEDPFDRTSVFAMYVGHKAFMLVADGEYRVVAAIEPMDSRALCRVVISRLLETGRYTHRQPARVKTRHADFLPTNLIESVNDQSMSDRGSDPLRQSGQLWKLLIGWIGPWVDVPVIGYWHDDDSESMTIVNNEEHGMRYKPSYGDKQREAQKRRKEEELQNRQVKTDSPQQEVPPPDANAGKNHTDSHDKRVA